MRRLCHYVYKAGGYKTDCGSVLIFRPIGKCDKCGRKPKERSHDDATSSDRTSNRITR